MLSSKPVVSELALTTEPHNLGQFPSDPILPSTPTSFLVGATDDSLRASYMPDRLSYILIEFKFET